MKPSASDELYSRRFPERAHREKASIWPEIVRYLDRWIDGDAPVLDLGCDRGYFIANVRAAERWATDARDVGHLLPDGVRFVQADGLELGTLLPGASFGTVFLSNYLEHLPDVDAVIEQLRVIRGLLRPYGRMIVLQPNIRFVGGAYWDFIDHRVPLTDRSLVEAGAIAGFRTVALIPRFLPYSTAGRLPVRPALVRAYLRFRPAWWLLGRQTLYVAEPAA